MYSTENIVNIKKKKKKRGFCFGHRAAATSTFNTCLPSSFPSGPRCSRRSLRAKGME